MIAKWLGLAVLFSSSIALATPQLITVPTKAMLPPDAVLTGETIFLNNCANGCDIKPGATDATTDTTSIASAPATFHEFASWDPNSASYIPGEWEQVVQCVKEAYSPYAVNVTDVRPLTEYSEAIVAGDPANIGLPSGVGGVGPSSPDCSPMTNQIAFAFAETAVADFASEDDNNRVWGICWVISQEIAHAYGLPNHEIKFTDGEPACSDPMTYSSACGGQKFFRNRAALCGEFAMRDCVCTPTVNSHLKLTTVFGPGQSLVAAPTVSITTPAMGDTVGTAFTVHPDAFSRRGIGHVDLYLNGHLWQTTPGAKFGAAGQPDTVYTLTAPNNVPDGVIDIVAKAYDDLEIETDSTTVTVTKGAPCADASTCATGQKCEAGKCFWDAPTGVLGDPCTYNEFCTTGLCQDSDVGQYCTQACVVNSADACPANFDCIATSDAQGVCLPHGSGGGGCCSVEGRESNRSIWAHLGLGVLAMGFIFRRRRRGTHVSR
jgi:hypothetical protein